MRPILGLGCLCLLFVGIFSTNYVFSQEDYKIIGQRGNALNHDRNGDILEVDFILEGSSIGIRYVIDGNFVPDYFYMVNLYSDQNSPSRTYFGSIVVGYIGHEGSWKLDTYYWNTSRTKYLSSDVSGSILTLTGLTLNDLGNRNLFYASALTLVNTHPASIPEARAPKELVDDEPRVPSGDPTASLDYHARIAISVTPSNTSTSTPAPIPAPAPPTGYQWVEKTVNLEPTEDTYVAYSDRRPEVNGANFGDSHFLLQGAFMITQGFELNSTYLKFDFASLPLNSSVVDAELFLYADSTNIPMWLSESASSYTGFIVKRWPDYTWSEHTLTHDNSPFSNEKDALTISAVNKTLSFLRQSPFWLSWNVTDTVSKSLGRQLTLSLDSYVVVGSVGYEISFLSKESTNPQLRPRLQVRYRTLKPVLSPPTIQPTPTVTTSQSGSEWLGNIGLVVAIGAIIFGAWALFNALVSRNRRSSSKEGTDTKTSKQDIIHCVHCGATIPSGSKFCMECGKSQA